MLASRSSSRLRSVSILSLCLPLCFIESRAGTRSSALLTLLPLPIRQIHIDGVVDNFLQIFGPWTLLCLTLYGVRQSPRIRGAAALSCCEAHNDSPSELRSSLVRKLYERSVLRV